MPITCPTFLILNVVCYAKKNFATIENYDMTLNYINWNLDPEIANIYGFSIRYYSLMFATGIILTIHTLKWLFKKEGLSSKNLDKLKMYGIVGLVIGMRLGHCLFYELDYYLANPLEMILPIRFLEEGGFEFTGFQGLASHGGVLGFLIALFFYSRKTKQSKVNQTSINLVNNWSLYLLDKRIIFICYFFFKKRRILKNLFFEV